MGRHSVKHCNALSQPHEAGTIIILILYKRNLRIRDVEDLPDFMKLENSGAWIRFKLFHGPRSRFLTSMLCCHLKSHGASCISSQIYWTQVYIPETRKNNLKRIFVILKKLCLKVTILLPCFSLSHSLNNLKEVLEPKLILRFFTKILFQLLSTAFLAWVLCLPWIFLICWSTIHWTENTLKNNTNGIKLSE